MSVTINHYGLSIGTDLDDLNDLEMTSRVVMIDLCPRHVW